MNKKHLFLYLILVILLAMLIVLRINMLKKTNDIAVDSAEKVENIEEDKVGLTKPTYENEDKEIIENTVEEPVEIVDTEVITEPEIITDPEVIIEEPIVTDSSDAIMLAKLVYGEGRGLSSVTEQACIMWTVLNRVDAGYGSNISSVITAPNQYYYSSSFGTVDDYGRDLVSLANDVISRWQREKNGETDVGRVLPSDYLWFSGDGAHNWFRNSYSGGSYWDYSWYSPYES